jgi:D-alanine transaminase
MSEEVVYLNEQFVPLSQASVSVLDRGFIFGDGVYDVIPVYRRKLFRPLQHLERLTRSLAAVGIDNIYSNEQWLQIIANLIEKSDGSDLLVYIQVTRGVATRAHAFPLNTKPTVFIMVNAMSAPTQEMRELGVACVTMLDMRWLHCDIKSTSLLGNVLAAQNAAQHSAIETIQFRDGFLTEASASNVWIVKNQTLLGPMKNNLVLEGIRYGLFEELCAKHAIPLEMRAIAKDEVFAADEVLLSSATKEILPVTLIDSKPVGLGKPGPMYAKLYAIYQEAKMQH